VGLEQRPTVIHLTATDPSWSYTCIEQAGVNFASASSRTATPARLQVYVNDNEVECVTLTVPHSWWPATTQIFCPTLLAGDILRVEADAPCDVRLDMFENGNR